MSSPYRYVHAVCLYVWMVILTGACHPKQQGPPRLDPDQFKSYVDSFNQADNEEIINFISNRESWSWMVQNIPLFECPDKNLEKIYYYRWWTYRKHIKETPEGFVLTEFIAPVNHAGKYNTISCALGHHLMEGRWLRNREFLDEYVHFWFRGDQGGPQPHFHNYSSWAADALYQRFMVDYNSLFITDLLPDLVADQKRWEMEKRTENGLYWQFDVRDGMEESISGSRTARNLRPTINSYMAGNAVAIANIAALAGNADISRTYRLKAERLEKLIQTKLWDETSAFFKVLLESGDHSDAREAIGFIPWYFHIPTEVHNYAWTQVLDTAGFKAPLGLTTAEQRHPEFRSHGVGTCEWDGAVWPFATSQTLVAMANFIRNYTQSVLTPSDYFEFLSTYARSHEKNGKPYIGEYHDEQSGEWLKGDNPRSKFYNHSTFCDLVITGLVGLIPRSDQILEIDPLVPHDSWTWFALDGLQYHGHDLAIFWDKTGEKYHRGKGMLIYLDGNLAAQSPELQRILVDLP